jgi:hypothetical protein
MILFFVLLAIELLKRAADERGKESALATPKSHTLTVKIAPDLHKSAASLATKRGENLSILVRDLLARAVVMGVEDALDSRIKGLETAVQKVVKRVDGAIAVIRSVEDDEVARRRVHEAAIREHLATLGAQISEVVAANTAVLQALVDGSAQHEADTAKALEGLLSRNSNALKMLVALLHAATPAARERWRDVESGMADGRKWREFADETLKKV